MNVLMISRFRTAYFAKQFATVFLSLLLCQPAWSQSTQNQMMSFEGTLTDTGGNAVDLQGQQLYFYITANDSFGKKCVLFAETSSSAGSADGSILHQFGNGSAVTSPVSYNNILSASVFSGIANGKLADGTGTACSVAVNATRFADVYSMLLNVTATVTLGSVPYSQYAANAALLNGKSDADFLLASSVSGGTIGQVLSRSGSGFSWVNLPAAAGGVSSIDLGSASATGILASARLPSYTGDVFSASGSTTMTVTRLQGTLLSLVAPVSGQALVFNGTSWIPTSVPTPLIPALNLSDVASAGVARANLGLGALATQNSVNLSTQATGMLQEFNLPAFNGDIVSNAGDDTLKVVAIQNKPVAATSPASGQIMSYNGSQWAPTTANFVRSGGDVLSGFYTVDGGLNVVSTTATNADVIPLFAIRRQTSNAGNGADNFGSMFLFDAENASGTMVNQAGIISRWITASGEQSQLEFQTKSNPGNMATRMTITGTGKVGIGTNSPNAMLDVQGTIKLGTNGAATSCSGIELGVLRYNNNNNHLETCNGTIWHPVGFWTKDGNNGLYNTSNIAIGTPIPDPSYRLLIESTASHLAYLRQDSTNHDGLLIETNGNNPGNFGLSVNGINGVNFIVKNDRRVGVNVFLPQANFHVSGTTILGGNTGVDGSLAVSGVIQLRSPAALPIGCTTAEEGAQRYNNVVKAMEYCNGTRWLGVNGLTSCDSGYTMVGTAGTPSAFCMSTNVNTPQTVTNASNMCRNAVISTGTKARLCTTVQLDLACENYNNVTPTFINLNNSIYHWTSNSIPVGGTSNYPKNIYVSYSSSNGSTCHIEPNTGAAPYNGRVTDADYINNSKNYRCCYE